MTFGDKLKGKVMEGLLNIFVVFVSLHSSSPHFKLIEYDDTFYGVAFICRHVLCK
jgi:hypothetical protein